MSATPLFEEERSVLLETAVSEPTRPVGIQNPGPWTTLTTNDCPSDASQVNRVDYKQWFKRDEGDFRRGLSEMLDLGQTDLVLDRNPEPDIERR